MKCKVHDSPHPKRLVPGVANHINSFFGCFLISMESYLADIESQGKMRMVSLIHIRKANDLFLKNTHCGNFLDCRNKRSFEYQIIYTYICISKYIMIFISWYAPWYVVCAVLRGITCRDCCAPKWKSNIPSSTTNFGLI